MTKILLASLIATAPQVFASQTLREAMVQSPKLTALVEALKASSGVSCSLTDSFTRESVRGPEGKIAITHQAACYDPDVFNPDQLGQLEVTYYGDGKTAAAEVGPVIEIKFEVFK